MSSVRPAVVLSLGSINADFQVRAEGVDVGAVRHAAGEKTGIALLATGPDGSKRSVSAPEANFGFRDADLAAVERAVHSAPAGAVLAADYEVSPRAGP